MASTDQNPHSHSPPTGQRRALLARPPGFRLSPTARGLLNLYIPSVLVSFGQSMAVPVVPLLAAAYKVSPGLAAQVVTVQLLGRAIPLVPSGILIDRLGPRTGMILGPILIIFGSVLTALAPNFWVLLGGQLVAGGGAGLWHLAREIAVLGLVRQDQRGRVISSFYGISSAGSILGPVVGGVLGDLLGFRAIFHAYAGMGGLVLLAAFAVKEAPRPPRREKAPGSSLGGIREIDPYYRVTFLVLIFGTMAAIMRHTALNSMLPLYAGTQLGYSATKVGSLFGIMGMVTLAMVVPAGFLSDKIGRKAATVPAAALSAITFFAFPFATSLVALSLLSVLVGIASGLAMGSMTTSTYDIVPEGARARLQALRRTTGEVGSLAGPVLGGAIAKAYSPGASFLFFAPVHLASALLLLFVAKESLVKAKRQEGDPSLARRGQG